MGELDELCELGELGELVELGELGELDKLVELGELDELGELHEWGRPDPKLSFFLSKFALELFINVINHIKCKWGAKSPTSSVPTKKIYCCF